QLDARERCELYDQHHHRAKANGGCIPRTIERTGQQPTKNQNESNCARGVCDQGFRHRLPLPMPSASQRSAAVTFLYIENTPAAEPTNTETITSQGEVPSRRSSQTPAKTNRRIVRANCSPMPANSAPETTRCAPNLRSGAPPGPSLRPR